MLEAALPPSSPCTPAIHQSRSVPGPLLLHACVSSSAQHCNSYVPPGHPTILCNSLLGALLLFLQSTTGSLCLCPVLGVACCCAVFGYCLAMIPSWFGAFRCLRRWTWTAWGPALGQPPNPAQSGAGGLSRMLTQASLSTMVMTLQRMKVPASLCFSCPPYGLHMCSLSAFIRNCFSLRSNILTG